MSWGFRSTVLGKDGSIDPGYLALYWGIICWSFNNAVILLIAVLVAWLKDLVDMPALIQSTGVALAANAGGFATMLGAVGLFRLGDKEKPAVATP